MRTIFFLSFLCIACGAKTSLGTGEDPGDAGTDSSDAFLPDAPFPDVGRPDVGPDAPPTELMLDCGPPQMAVPGMEVRIQAVATRGEIGRGRWVIEEVPPMSMAASPEPPDSTAAVAFIDVPGVFAYRFIAQSPSGEEASCVAEVFSVAGPPLAACPREEVLAFALEPVSVMGAGFDDDGPVTYSWEIIGLPPGSSPRLDGIEDPVVTFTGDVAGSYILALTVTDVFGETDTCRANVRVIAPPVIACDADVFSGPTRQPLEVLLGVTDDTRVVTHTWEMVTRPPTSSAVIERMSANRAIFTPDKQGSYELLYTATDTDGLSSTCLVTAIGLPTPPTVTCPEVVETPPLTTVSVLAEAVDDGESLSYNWELVSREVGSAAGPPSPRNRPETNFTPDIAGEYVLRVTVTDDDGEMALCETTVLAFSDEGLRVEMFWNTGGSTDMDIHLGREEAMRWFSNDDCYYANCDASDGEVLNWYSPGTEDNPSLDLDDTNGFGPENINIEEPEPGVYTIGVHAFSGRGGVTVRVYCGGDRTMPRAEFGPVTIGPRPGGRDFWRVADVEIIGPAMCNVTERFAPGGGADIIDDDDAMSSF